MISWPNFWFKTSLVIFFPICNVWRNKISWNNVCGNKISRDNVWRNKIFRSIVISHLNKKFSSILWVKLYTYVINPETGRRIQIGGVTFNHLIFTSYDFINGELVRRATAPPPTPRQYFLNTQTNRLIQAGSRRYHEMIRTGWDIIEDYYLIPPGESVAETIAMVQDLGNEIA